MKTLYIHIGRAKTGTSALQKFFRQNMAVLEKYGIVYAQTGLYYDNHQPLAWSLFREAFDRGRGKYWKHASKYAVLDRPSAMYWADLLQEIASSQHDRFLISSEEFGVVLDNQETARLMAEFLPGIKVKIIVYFRRQDQFLQSVYNQVVKQPDLAYSGSFQEYIKPILDVGGADPLKVLTPFAEAFGKENIIVRVYERGQFYKKNILDDFLNILGVQRSDEFIIEKNNPNPAISPAALECIRLANSHDIPARRELNTLITRIIDGESGDRIFTSHSIVPVAECQALLDRFKESNERVAQEYLNRQDGKLFSEYIEDQPIIEKQIRNLTQEDLITVIIELFKLVIKPSKINK